MLNLAWLIWLIIATSIVMLLWFIVEKISSQMHLAYKTKLLAKVVIVLVIFGGNMILYSKFGAHAQLADFYTPQNLAYRKQLKVIQPMAAKWRARELKLRLDVLANPKNIAVWRELAALYVLKQDIAAAANALQQVGTLEQQALPTTK